MKSIFRKINHAGLEGLENPLDYRRVLFVNSLALVSSAISLSVTILIIFEGLFPQFIITLSGGLLFLLVVYFNYLRYYILARTYFLGLTVAMLTAASFVALKQGRYNEVENILVAFMAVNYLLYDGKFRYVGFLSIYGVLIWLKFVKQDFSGQSYDLNFYLTIQNVSILCLIIFLFSEAFRKSLLRSFVRLKEKDELLYSMIDNVPLYIGLVDKSLRYRMVNLNYEKSFGLDRDKIIGSHIKDVLPPNILKTHQPLVEQALEGESPEFLEHTRMPDGSSFYAGGKYMPVYADNGEIVGVSVFVSDVTKLEVAKNKLATANTTKDKLFSIVAHDIRGPLDLFDGLLDVSQKVEISPKDFKKHQEKIKDKLSELRGTVNTLLDWARTQLDGVNSLPVSTDIEEIVKSNLDLYKELIDHKKISVHAKIEPEIKAWVDSNHLKIGVRNILHNALKFTPAGGDIHLIGLRKNGSIILKVKDTGVGMNLEQVKSILEKELQPSSSGTEGEMGTGLGLSLSLELLEKNNCKVDIDSEPGKGTEVVIEMQVSDKQSFSDN
ncbi:MULTISPECIES: PAS domain-containing sensor histidine kinase [unclassified Ekhidna]|jgi:PAS domain S-box-containing protein|uniref:sensor histidine kinase n=1 Tax=unclassified Ekhidna TaxID=2632188 RepID=UPI0032DFC916